jgi:signal transduction histidine kinase
MTQHAMRLAKVEVAARVEPGLPPAWGLTGKIDQVLINLVNNARDSGATRIELEAGIVDAACGARLRLTVLDNGPGIPEQVLGRLFEQMVTTKPKGVGTGLGLRICRRIVEEMHGTISAANRPEGGACFQILLPLASRETDAGGA